MQTHFYPHPCHHSLRIALVSGLLCFSISQAKAQVLPSERVGVSGQELAVVKLPADFNVEKGRTLRMREVTIAPGGLLPMHSHQDRPSVSYVLKGTLTEYLEGQPQGRQITTGESYATHGPRAHALQNRGDTPAVFLEVDLP